MFGNIGPMELVLVLGIALMLFGAKRLPELGQSLGKGIREFKRSVSNEELEPRVRSGAETIGAEPKRLTDRAESIQTAQAMQEERV